MEVDGAVKVATYWTLVKESTSKQNLEVGWSRHGGRAMTEAKPLRHIICHGRQLNVRGNEYM
jgi:hypothetical protein